MDLDPLGDPMLEVSFNQNVDQHGATSILPIAFHASQTLSEKCQKSTRPLKLLYSLNTGHHHLHARAE